VRPHLPQRRRLISVMPQQSCSAAWHSNRSRYSGAVIARCGEDSPRQLTRLMLLLAELVLLILAHGLLLLAPQMDQAVCVSMQSSALSGHSSTCVPRHFALVHVVIAPQRMSMHCSTASLASWTP